MTIKMTPHFQNKWTVFWATTYTLDLRTFEEFWLRRLGDPPLNVTLLVDSTRLMEVWSGISENEAWRLRRVNRDYLVRGVRITTSRFHPKTYFFANEKEGVLLVGSGNLGLDGLEEGHEVFSRFTSHKEDDFPAIRSWRDWMERVVARVNDREVGLRWRDLQSKTPWLEGTASTSPFITNWSQSLWTQIIDKLPMSVDELHVMAPFFDPGVKMLERAVSTTRPEKIHLYASKDMSVDGPRLVSVLQDSHALVHIHRVTPDEFVHAKLLGIVAGEDGWLLSGSANMSQAAFMGRVDEGLGNVEAGVLVQMDASELRAAFRPAGLELLERPIDDLTEMTLRAAADGQELPILLHSATRIPDGRISITYTDVSENQRLWLTTKAHSQSIENRQTAQPFLLSEDTFLVWLTDETGTVLSNRVPVDEPTRLARWLEEQTEVVDRPRELEQRDLETPVGQMLERLHRECIFDIDETPAHTRIRGAAPEREDADPNFWDRLTQDELRRDPRAERYRGWGSTSLYEEDDVFLLLRTMLNEAPRQDSPRILPRGADGDNDKSRPGKSWTPDRRLQVRLYNLLDRWCRAISDSRLAWINPYAPIRNYTALLTALMECWTEDYLREERLISLVETLLGNFVRTERANGYLFCLITDERNKALAHLSLEAVEATAALVYVGLRPAARWREYIFDWQAFLVPGLELGLIQAGENTAKWVGLLVEAKVSDQDVERRLAWAATFIDDARWGEAVQRDLDLSEVKLAPRRVGDEWGAIITVSAVPNPLSDPRFVSLLLRVIDYRKAESAIIRFPTGVISLRLGGLVCAMVNGVEYESDIFVDRRLIETLEANGAGWSTIMSLMASQAS